MPGSTESSFTVVERAIVDWLEVSGFDVAYIDCEWVLRQADEPVSLTSIAAAVLNALEQK